MPRRLDPSSWASRRPFGLGLVKPHHMREMAGVAWENRDALGFAWRILNDGVCDGCALGTTGMKDATMDGIHLCTVRLKLLRLNTMGAIDEAVFSDAEALRRMDEPGLRRLGRLAHPMLRRKGEKGFTRISWEEGLTLAADHIREIDPRRLAFYLTSRGLTNEVYYVAQKVARFLGTNHIDNSARICHAPSTTAMKRSLGIAASTCSYRDWIGTDLLVFIGSDAPNNQPVSTKYMVHAKREGTRIVMVNPFREPGLDRYWVPSVPESAVFGTRLTDDYFQIHQGGDVAFLNGVLKQLIADGRVDDDFIARHTEGFAELRADLAAQDWETLERLSGATRERMADLARLLAEARSAVFVWSMGLTQHRFGADNVQAVIHLALARGFVGRAHCGLMPIRGHSGVQGGAEMGAVPWSLPGGIALDAENVSRFSELWGFQVPEWRGFSAVECVHAAHRGEIDTLWAIGGNHLRTLPDPDYCEEALRRVPFRVHHDIILNHQALIEPEDTVLLLPATTRYEQPGGGTSTSTERRVWFSPEIRGRRIGEARSEWETLRDLAVRVGARGRRGARGTFAFTDWSAGRITFADSAARAIVFTDAASVRADIAAANPVYEGIRHLAEKGDVFQWGGERLCEGGVFPRPGGRARFVPVRPPELAIPEGHFHLSTRRGKQFNSMVQAARDPLTGARRDDVLMAASDAARLGLAAGDALLLRSETGEMRGRCRIADIREGNLQAHWPEANVLIRADVVEPSSGIPEYSAVVEVRPVRGE